MIDPIPSPLPRGAAVRVGPPIATTPGPICRAHDGRVPTISGGSLVVCVLAATPTARSLGSVCISRAGARHRAGRASRASNVPVSLREVA